MSDEVSVSGPQSESEENALLRRENRQLRRQTESIERQQHMRIGAMRAVQSELETTVDRLREALEESRRASRIQETFLANLSHELRTPLHGINSAAELLEQRRFDSDSEGLIRMIASSGSKLRTQFETLIDFSIAQSGQLVLEPGPIELALLIEGAVGPDRLEAESKGITLGVDLSPGMPKWLRIDAPRFAQALGSLVGNAVQYTNAGGVEVRVREEPLASAFDVWVEDSGIGIPKHELDRVFDPFSQVDESRARLVGGTGIGLAHARRIVMAMGGSIELQSKVNSGTTVRVRLPLDAMPDCADDSDLSGLAGLRVLVVDDNSVNRLVASKMLERFDCRVDAAASGEEALQALAISEAPDVILMDCSMPGMDGYETTRAIQSLPEPLARIPVIALTAHALAEDRRRAFESGMCGFLTKPISPAELGTAMLRLLAHALQ